MSLGAELFAEALRARIAALRANVEAELDGRVRDRRQRRHALLERLGALTLHLRVAHAEAAAETARVAPCREEARRTLNWLLGFERERACIEDEIRAQLRAAHAEERQARTRAAAACAGLDGLGRQLAHHVERALAASSAAASEESPGSSTRQTNVSRSLDERLTVAIARLQRALEMAGARARGAAEHLARRRIPDFERAAAILDQSLAASIGGGKLAQALPGSGRAAAPRLAEGSVPPGRKRARVPRFVLGRFYREGGLSTAGGATRITFTNPLGFCIIQGGDAIVVDGRAHPRGRTLLDNGERRLGSDQLSATSYLKFPKGAELRVTLDGLALGPGKHRVHFALELRKMGWVDLDVEDSTR